MKRKKLLTLCLIPFLLAGCGNNKNNENKDNNSTNNTQTNSNTDSGNTTGKEDGGNTSGKEEVEKNVGPKMTEEAWNKMFSAETFNNLKVTGSNILNPTKEPYMGPMITRSKKVEFVYTSAGSKVCTQVLTNDEKFEIFDDDFKAFLEADPEYIYINGFGTAENAYQTFLVSLGMSFETQPVRNSSDDGYVILSNLEEPINVYYEQAEQKDTIYTYYFDDESEKYFKILSFPDDTGEFDFDSFIQVNQLLKLNGCFDKATYDEEKKCYAISFSLLYEGDSIENYDIPMYLYFNDGLLTKVTFCTEYDSASQVEFLFSNYGNNEVTLPTNLKSCDHKNNYYNTNDEYHYVCCSKCGNVAEYSKHIYKNGFCETCEYCDDDLEIICGDDGIEHVYLYKNVLTGKYFNANFFDFYESTNSELTRTTYDCFDGTCNFNCVRTYEDRVPIDGSPCEYYEVSKVSFYDGETKVHDDITIEEKKVEHTYEILEMQPLEGEILDEYGYRDEDLGTFHGSVKCKKCGKIVEDVDIYVYSSDAKFDQYKIYKPGYLEFIEYGRMPHKIDEMNSKCVHCGKTESEITKVYSLPKMDIDFHEVSTSDFTKNYYGEFTYEEFTSEINATFYIGDSEYGEIYTDTLTYSEDSWHTNLEIGEIVSCVPFASTTSKSIIDTSIGYINDRGYDVKYYDSNEGIGLIVSDDGYAKTKFYLDASGFLIRYEYITNNGYDCIQASFSADL